MKHLILIRLSFVMIMLVMSGCTSTYKRTDLKTLSSPLKPNESVAISIPANGRYNNELYQNSGEMTAIAIKTAFARHSTDAVIVENCQDVNGVKQIKDQHFKYYVKPRILHWEERATEWSGKPDRIEIQLSIYDVISGEQISKTSYTGKSKWATFGGDHPQDLLTTPTQRFVDSLY